LAHLWGAARLGSAERAESVGCPRCVRDPRFTPLLDLFLAQQDEQGRWRCGSVSRTWPLEKRNRPSKWVTLDALRLLKIV